MIGSSLLSNAVFPLKTSDTGEEALHLMAEYHVSHLPIVNNKHLLGLISEDDILSHDIFEPIGAYQLSLIRNFVKDTDHLFEAMDVLSKNRLTLVPVIDKEENYQGVITAQDLLTFFADNYSFTEPGSLLVLEINSQDYYLSQISRIIESEDANILSVFITREPNSTHLLVTIKINRLDLSRVISALNRYDYTIRATYSEVEYVDDLKERFDNFLSYLNV
jgi:acetoin utilization protein AcuB